MRRAVVIGASLAGSMCARVLAEHAEEVVVLEPDGGVASPGPRRAVPQGRQIHGLWYTGLSAMGDLYPGLLDELVAGGAVSGDVGRDFGWWRLGERRAPVRVGEPGVLMSRPFLESTIRARTLALASVELRAGRAAGLSVSGGRVDGVLVGGEAPDCAGERLPAEVVVDCSGRGSRLGRWLEELGFEPPTTEQVAMDIGYASRLFHRPPGVRLADGTNGLASLAVLPRHPRSAVVAAIEGDRWLVGVGGYAGDRPGADEEGFAERCLGEQVPPLAELLASAEPLSGVLTYQMAASIRRDFHKLRRLPAGLFAAGDAVASFNPAYGQGMTCAALHALALRSCLAGATGAAGYFAMVRRVTDAAWTVSVSEDFRLPTTTGRRPPGTWLAHRLGDWYANAARLDGGIHERFLRVAAMEAAPSSLAAPSALLRLGALAALRRAPAGMPVPAR